MNFILGAEVSYCIKQSKNSPLVAPETCLYKVDANQQPAHEGGGYSLASIHKGMPNYFIRSIFNGLIRTNGSARFVPKELIKQGSTKVFTF